jgi:hypothetical protein
MLTEQVRANLRLRMGKWPSWMGVVAFGLPFLILRLYYYDQVGLDHPAATVSALLLPFLLSASYAWLAPVPWRWTSDASPMAGPLRGVLQSLLWNSLITVFLVALDAALLHAAHPPKPLPLGVVLWTNLLFMVPTLTLVGYFIASGERAEEERRQTDAQARDARDQALQNQLNPHVLFNALNGLAELVRQNPVAAEKGILDLAELCRMVLDHGQRQWVPLAEERRLVERYLAVERLRLGDRLHVIWQWDEVLDGLMVPPLLLQPLVENAIKHGVGKRPGVSQLYITASHALGQAEVLVENEGQLTLGGGRKGIGFRNLAQRLELHFPGESELVLETENGWIRSGWRIQERALGVKR